MNPGEVLEQIPPFIKKKKSYLCLLINVIHIALHYNYLL